jgi:hypothetical protein
MANLTKLVQTNVLAYTLHHSSGHEKEKLKRWRRAATHLRKRLMPAAQKHKGV